MRSGRMARRRAGRPHTAVRRGPRHGIGPPPAASSLLWLTLGACALAPGPGAPGDPSTAGALPPPGYGTLRQDDVSIVLSSGDLRIMVTPLHESVTRVTAPDTEQRLSGLAEAHGAGAADRTLFLVSFYSDQPDVRFVPEEVQLVSRGIRLRPLEIAPVTPGWGQRRLRQRETEMAVYAFSREVDLESELIVAYGLEQSSAWSSILRRVQAERARARARAGIGDAGRQASRSYLAILR